MDGERLPFRRTWGAEPFRLMRLARFLRAGRGDEGWQARALRSWWDTGTVNVTMSDIAKREERQCKGSEIPTGEVPIARH